MFDTTLLSLMIQIIIFSAPKILTAEESTTFDVGKNYLFWSSQYAETDDNRITTWYINGTCYNATLILESYNSDKSEASFCICYNQNCTNYGNKMEDSEWRYERHSIKDYIDPFISYQSFSIYMCEYTEDKYPPPDCDEPCTEPMPHWNNGLFNLSCWNYYPSYV